MPSDEAAQLSVDEIAERLQSKLPRGISDAEAARRHEEFGFNEFDIGEEESLLANYVRLWLHCESVAKVCLNDKHTYRQTDRDRRIDR